MLCQLRRFLRIARQEIEEPGKPLLVPSEVWRELPQNRAQFFAQREHAGGKEIRERRFNIPQFLHVGDEPGSLHAKNKSWWCFGVPPLVTRRALKRVERSIDLDRIKSMAGELELEAVRELFRVKNAAPARIRPTGDSDEQVVRRPLGPRGDQIISRESCHKIPCFSQSFRNVDSPSFSSGPY